MGPRSARAGPNATKPATRHVQNLHLAIRAPVMQRPQKPRESVLRQLPERVEDDRAGVGDVIPAERRGTVAECLAAKEGEEALQ